MPHLIPGKVIQTFQTKAGQEAVIRYPKWEDLDAATDYINALSQEDTFISVSGETISKKDESQFLSKMFVMMEAGHVCLLTCWIETELVGITSLERNLRGKRRHYHQGILGLTVAKAYRSQGVGQTLLETVLQEAPKQIPGLQKVTLSVFANNEPAQNLYRKLGFKEYGRLPESYWYQNQYIDEVLMYLPLPQK